MPYDLFVTTSPAPPAGEIESAQTLWVYCGTWPHLSLAQRQRDLTATHREGYVRWRLFHTRSRISPRGRLHSEGPYPPKENPYA